mmetsp:Transcript_29606/g.78390  ORF Transcript_29606/g.78390 Transcript_29606/m.78390 type:complete len:200 (-) Transcript_29606:373-972(-)
MQPNFERERFPVVGALGWTKRATCSLQCTMDHVHAHPGFNNARRASCVGHSVGEPGWSKAFVARPLRRSRHFDPGSHPCERRWGVCSTAATRRLPCGVDRRLPPPSGTSPPTFHRQQTTSPFGPLWQACFSFQRFEFNHSEVHVDCKLDAKSANDSSRHSAYYASWYPHTASGEHTASTHHAEVTSFLRRISFGMAIFL